MAQKIKQVISIQAIKEICSLCSIPRAEFSTLFMKQLKKSLDTDCHAIRDAINTIKNLQHETSLEVKDQRAFRGNILSGFWYIHYPDYSSKGIAENIFNEWRLNKPQSNKMNDAIHIWWINNFGTRDIESPESDNALRAASELASIITSKLEERKKRHQLTGERIVFGELRNGNRAFLTLATHEEKDEIVRKRLNECAKEFPDLFGLY